MRNLAVSLLVIAAVLLLLRAGMQPVDRVINPPRRDLPAHARVDWSLAGSFGEPAKALNPQEHNPWLKQFNDGGFLEIAGLSAGEEEVFVCDTGLSRIQVFNRDGRHLRNMGIGIPIREVLPTDIEFYLEDNMVTREIPRFNDILGPLFADKYRGIFQAADVAITPEGWFMADMLRTGDRRADHRKPSLLWFGNDDSVKRFGIDTIIWPQYIAAEGQQVVLSEPEGNALYWGERDGDNPADWKMGFPTTATQYTDILRVKESYFGHRRYNSMMARHQNVSQAPGEYSRVGGMDFGFGKLVICDSGNARIQVYDATGRDMTRRHSLVLTLPGVNRNGELRFAVPLDVAVDDHDGQVYILDSSRREVAILDDHFNRIGSFGLGDLNTPRAITISPDGNDIYVSDDGDQCVYHYSSAQRR
ncbi:hypothetical protein KDL44_15035 [bacterium]|nr:hypothetical protein [bacterium]